MVLVKNVLFTIEQVLKSLLHNPHYFRSWPIIQNAKLPLGRNYVSILCLSFCWLKILNTSDTCCSHIHRLIRFPSWKLSNGLSQFSLLIYRNERTVRTIVILWILIKHLEIHKYIDSKISKFWFHNLFFKFGIMIFF